MIVDGVRLWIIVGIVIIFLDFNFKVFLLYGWFLIMCLDVMKLIK